MSLLIKCSVGEVADKLSILDVKLNKIDDDKKLEKIRAEHAHLLSALEALADFNFDLLKKCFEVNIALWDVEDSVRDTMAVINGEGRIVDRLLETINLAKLTYDVVRLNGQRSALKAKINKLYDKEFAEVKQYGS